MKLAIHAHTHQCKGGMDNNYLVIKKEFMPIMKVAAEFQLFKKEIWGFYAGLS